MQAEQTQVKRVTHPEKNRSEEIWAEDNNFHSKRDFILLQVLLHLFKILGGTKVFSYSHSIGKKLQVNKAVGNSSSSSERCLRIPRKA